MNKFFFLGAALTMAVAFTSCKSSESAYKKAYEKAQQANQNNYAQQNTPVDVTPVTPTTTTTTTTDYSSTQSNEVDYSNVSVRTENVSVISGSALKAYSVVVGSFSVQSNATALSAKLNNSGYSSRVVRAKVNGNDWYRVVAGSFDTKNQAGSFRASLKGNYPDAWLLYSK